MDVVSTWAQSEGWEPAAEEIRVRTEERLRQLSSRSGGWSGCWFRREADVLWIVGEAELRLSSVNSSDRSPVMRYAVVFAESKSETLPTMSLRKGAAGSGLVSRIMAGDQQVFADEPAFQSEFHVTADRPELVRQCLDARLRQALLSVAVDFTLRTRPRHFLVLAKTETLSPDRWQRLFEVVHQVHSGVSGNAGRLQDSVGQEPRRRDRIATANAAGGVAGFLQRRFLESSCFDRQELDAFLAQPTPRDVPRQIARVFEGDRFVPIFSLVFACMLLCVGSILGMALEEVPARYLAPTFCGAAALLFAGLFAWLRIRLSRRRAVLSSGAVVAAQVERISETGWVSGNERVYAAMLRLTDSGRKIPVRVQGLAAARLSDLAGSETEIRILQDQIHPDRVLVMDAYVV